MYRRFVSIPKSQSFFMFGPRGSGKSTLLKQHFEGTNVLWVDLLNQQQEFKLSQNPDSLLELWQSARPKWIVIDEVQKIPRLLDVVHRGIENYKILFALTGSSSRKLKRGGANLLAGRAASLFLSPFCSLELGDDFNLDRALSYGLLPYFWGPTDWGHQEVVRSLYSYVQTYLKEEIAAEQLVRNLEPFRRFLVSAAQSNAQILNFAKIERDSGISHSQAERHFEILCDTLLGRYLEPYEKSIRKRQSKKSKFYFFDTGVVRTLQNFVEEKLTESTYEYGTMFETFVMNEFFKLREAFEKKWSYSYLNTNKGVEIDLIIEKPRGKPILVEIKSTKNIKDEHVQSFKKIDLEFKGCEKYLLSNDVESQVKGEVHCLYWQEGLKNIFEL